MTGAHLFAGVAGAVALAWWVRIAPALLRLHSVADLRETKYESRAENLPSLSVIVPARNEAKAIAATLEGLLASNTLKLQILAVDDRSTDATGAIMDAIAAQPEADGRLRVIHVTELPSGWLGKPHAMSLAAEAVKVQWSPEAPMSQKRDMGHPAHTDWLLFTDADVLFAPDIFDRALTYAEANHVDHLVVYPTMILHGLGEHIFVSFCQTLSVWAGRPWRIANRKAKRDFVGVGAFNLIRRSVYEDLGGFVALRMEVVEDMRLGYCVKQAGYVQHGVFARDMVRLRWAESVMGMVENLTKNIFAAFRFRVSLLIAAFLGIILLCATPCVALAIPGPARWAGVAVFAAIILLHLRYWKQFKISPIYVIFFPVGMCLLLYALLRSLLLTLWRGGVLWRGTLYPLDELKRHAGPLR